jgi:hypothetical protein
MTARFKRSLGKGKGSLPLPSELRRVRIQISLLPSTLDYLRRFAVVSNIKNPSPSKVIAVIITDFGKEHPEILTSSRVRGSEEKPVDW